MKIIGLGIQAGRIGLVGLMLGIGGCGGDYDNGPDCRYDADWLNGRCSVDFEPPAIVIADGIWRGRDANGADVVALVSPFSRLRYVDGIGRIGSGVVSAGTDNTLGGSFELVTAYGDAFADGSTVADCVVSGTLVERVTITVSEECITRAGLAFDEQLTLTFDPMYNQGSSLTETAGVYQLSSGDVLNVGADGALFSQSGSTDCVISGDISVIVSFANMYAVTFEIDNCTGVDAFWNGSGFDGLAFVDTGDMPEMLFFAVNGEVASMPVGIIEEAIRL